MNWRRQVVSGTWRISIKGLKEIIYTTFVKTIDMLAKHRNNNVGIYKFQNVYQSIYISD